MAAEQRIFRRVSVLVLVAVLCATGLWTTESQADPLRLMLSRRADSLTAGQDVFLLTYDTFDDLIASPASGSANGAFSSINISDNYIATGLAFEFENVASVSEPRSSDLVLVALALLCWTSMTKRSRRVARPRFVC